MHLARQRLREPPVSDFQSRMSRPCFPDAIKLRLIIYRYILLFKHNPAAFFCNGLRTTVSPTRAQRMVEGVTRDIERMERKRQNIAELQQQQQLHARLQETAPQGSTKG